MVLKLLMAHNCPILPRVSGPGRRPLAPVPIESFLATAMRGAAVESMVL